jgi:hypothetical protein
VVGQGLGLGKVRERAKEKGVMHTGVKVRKPLLRLKAREKERKAKARKERKKVKARKVRDLVKVLMLMLPLLSNLLPILPLLVQQLLPLPRTTIGIRIPGTLVMKMGGQEIHGGLENMIPPKRESGVMNGKGTPLASMFNV